MAAFNFSNNTLFTFRNNLKKFPYHLISVTTRQSHFQLGNQVKMHTLTSPSLDNRNGAHRKNALEFYSNSINSFSRTTNWAILGSHFLKQNCTNNASHRSFSHHKDCIALDTSCIGFIGLGTMGRPTIEHLLKMKHNVVVYDIDDDKVKQMTDMGAHAASSIAELATNSTCVVSMITGPQHARDVYLGPAGVIENMKKKKSFLVDCSTIGYHTALEIRKAAKESDQIFLDCPMSGGAAGAKNGTLTFMIGATEEEFAQVKDFFASFGKTIVHTGTHGSAQLVKICNNICFAINTLGACESYSLATKLGANMNSMTDVLKTSSGNSFVITAYNPVPGMVKQSPSNADYKEGYTLDLLIKDLDIGLQMAKEVGSHLPILENSVLLFKSAQKKGMGNLDFSAVFKTY